MAAVLTVSGSSSPVAACHCCRCCCCCCCTTLSCCGSLSESAKATANQQSPGTDDEDRAEQHSLNTAAARTADKRTSKMEGRTYGKKGQWAVRERQQHWLAVRRSAAAAAVWQLTQHGPLSQQRRTEHSNEQRKGRKGKEQREREGGEREKSRYSTAQQRSTGRSPLHRTPTRLLLLALTSLHAVSAGAD